MTAGKYDDDEGLDNSTSVSASERFFDGFRDEAGLGEYNSGTMSSTYPIDLNP